MQASTSGSPLPLRQSRRAAIVAEHARRLLAETRLSDDERVRVEGALRACESLRGSSAATTMPGVSMRKIVNASARDVARVWERAHGSSPWPERPLLLRWLDR